MIGATLIFLFLVEIGSGTLLTLWLLRRFEISRSLRQMLAGLGGGLVAAALPFGAQAFGAGPLALASLLRAPLLFALALVTSCAGYVVCLSAMRVDWGARLLAAAGLAGVASLGSGAGALAAGPGTWAGLLLGGYLLSATLLLGSTLGAMVVGHWYLVDRRMAIGPLRLASGFLLFAVAARIAVVAGPAVRFWAAQAAAGFSGGGAVDLSIFWLQRALFGLVGPFVLGIMVWHAVRLRATQAATGLLYIVLIFVIAGEMLSHYLLLRTDRFL